MIRTLAFAALLAAPPGGPWLGADKIKHFLVSAFVHSVSFSAARALGASRPTAQWAGAGSAAAAGLWKEIHDRRSGKPFSTADLLWDGAGALTAASLLNGTR